MSSGRLFPGETDVTIVSRDEWGARSAEESRELLRPVKYVVFASTRSDACTNKEECSKVLQKLQKSQMDAGLPDIVHNFMISSDGTVYEGTGWEGESWLYDEEDDMARCTIQIGYIGYYNDSDNLPTPTMVTAAFKLIHQGIRKLHIKPRYKVSELNLYG